MNKLTKQLLSLFMCVLMVVESGFNAGITGYATENHSGSHISVYAVKALAKLKEDVAYQTVEFGTPKSKLELPKTIFALACDEKAEEDLEDDEVIYVASTSETIAVDKASSSETSKNASQSQINISPDFMTDEQKEVVVELLSQKEKPSVKEIEKETGLKLKGYRVIDLPLKWESDTSFGGEFDPKVPGVYRFISEVKNESKYVLYDPSLPTVDVEILEEGSKAFSAVWSDEDVEITVSAPAGVFPNDSVLKVERITSENENLKIDEAVEKTLDNDKSVKQTYSYDIKVLDSDGKEVEPVTAGGKKVDVTFKSQAIMDAAQNDDQYVSVYHFKDIDKEDVEKAAKANNAEESLVDVVIDALSGLVSDKNKGEKLKKPEHMKAEEPEEAAVSEVDDISGDTDRTEKKDSAPKSDDSEKVSVDGELTVKTTDFSIYTIAFYTDSSNIKAYYLSIGSESDSQYSYEEGDTLTLSITAQGGDEKTLAVIYPDEATFDEFVRKVTEAPEDLLTLLETEGTSLGSEITNVPAKTGNIGLVADSEGINVTVTALHRDGVTYNVTSRERTLDETEPLVFKGLYWDLDQKFYVEQNASDDLQGNISYELSGFGNNGGKATISVLDKENNTRTINANSDEDGKATFTVDASDKFFTIDSTDIIEIKPVESEEYSFKPEGGPHAISIDKDHPTTFEFSNLKNYTHTIHLTVTKDGDPDSSDAIDYTISGLSAGEDVTIRKQMESDVVDDADHKAESDGTLSFTLPVSVASFSVLSREKEIKLDSAEANDSSVDNLILVTALPETLNNTEVLGVEFLVPSFEIKNLNLDDPSYPELENATETADFSNLKNKNKLTDVSALYDVPGYRFKYATITTGTGNTVNTVKLDSGSTINNYKYKNGSAEAVQITENAILTLYYSEIISYPVYIETENVAKDTAINLKLGNLDDKSVSVYLLNSDNKTVKSKLNVTVDEDAKTGSCSFTTTNGESKYYLMVTSDDKDFTLMVDDSNNTFQQRAGTGVDPIRINEKVSEDNFDKYTLFVEGVAASYTVTKLWEDAGKNNTEKKNLIGKNKDVKYFMSLQYRLVYDEEDKDKNTSWKDFDIDAMKYLGYHSDFTENATAAFGPKDASFTYKNPTAYEYIFKNNNKKLFTKYIYRDADGKIKKASIEYRIAEGKEIKAKYFSKYEDDDTAHTDNPDGVVLRNYLIQTYEATVKWNDKDAIEGDRPETGEWLKHITLYKVIEGDANQPEIVSIIPLNVEPKEDEITEGDIWVTDNSDGTWTVKVMGYAYDKNNYPVHYYITQNSLDVADGNKEVDGQEGNKIINRRYEPTYENVSSAANKTNGLYINGTLVNVLSGDTKYTMYKEWKDDGNTKRPTAKIRIYRYVRTNPNGLSQLSAIQGYSDSYVEIKDKDPDYNDNKHFIFVLPEVKEANEDYFAAYDTDGVQFIYVGKEQMSGDSSTGKYKTELHDKSGNIPTDRDGGFVLNGETLVNIIEQKINIKATKTWVATSRQDVRSSVSFTLYRSKTTPSELLTLSNPESIEGVTKVDTQVLGRFSSDITSDSYVWTGMPKYDDEGNRIFYFVREDEVKTQIKDASGQIIEGLESATFETVDGKDYFVTKDGYRYLQTYDKMAELADGSVEIVIKNTLVGNAQVKLTKTFPDGLSTDDLDDANDSADKSVSLSFDVFQNKLKIGTITRKYGKGSWLWVDENKDGNWEYKQITDVNELKGLKFKDEVVIDSYKDKELTLAENFTEFTSLLPRYDSFGVEYTYSIFEHRDATNRGYLPTLVNNLSEEKYTTDSESDHPNEKVIYPYKSGDNYLLDSVEIYNHIGGQDKYTVYKEWFDGDDTETRESVSFVLQYKEPGSDVWKTVGDEHTIDVNSEHYSKYVFVNIPTVSEIPDLKKKFNAWRDNSYADTGTSGTFRVKETKLGNSDVFYYGDHGDTTIMDVFTNPDDYLGHDWDTFKCDQKNFEEKATEDLDYGFVQGTKYDYDVLVIDRAKATKSYINYQYYEEGNVVANRNFDFALSNKRVGVIYIDIVKTWNDGNDKLGVRPEKIKLMVEVGKEKVPVTLQPDEDSNSDKNTWSAKLGPFRKYDDVGKLIDYSPKLLEVNVDDPLIKEGEDGKILKKGDTYEVFIYNSDEESQKIADKYFNAYNRGGDINAEFHAGEDHHTGDHYSMAISNSLTQTVTPVVNKFWMDYDSEDGNTNNRPAIYTVLYVEYTDASGHHVRKLDKDLVTKKFIGYDWTTKIDEAHKTYNWWKVEYASLPRFDSNQVEYTYYIGEAYASSNTNEYAEIGAYEGKPYKDVDDIAHFDIENKIPQTITITEGDGAGCTIYAAKVSTIPGEEGTIVNRPRNSRTVTGVKVYNNIPKGYSELYLPEVKVELWRVPYGVKIPNTREEREKVGEQVHQYQEKEADVGIVKDKYLVELENPTDKNKYIYEVLKDYTSLYQRTFTFYDRDENGNYKLDTAGNKVKAQVPKYDDTGRPYTYYIEEDVENEYQKERLKKIYDFNVKPEDTLTNGIIATNARKDRDNYKITFYKKWDGLEEYLKDLDDDLLKYWTDNNMTDKEKSEFIKTYAPKVKVRLYRYLQTSVEKTNENGEKYEAFEEMTNTKELVSGSERTLTYDIDNQEYTSCTWENLDYYAPNLNPYKYYVFESYVNFNDDNRASRPYTEVYEADIDESTGKVTLKKAEGAENQYINTPANNVDWNRYKAEVKGNYDLDADDGKGSGSGTAGIINKYVKEWTDLTIKKLWDREYDKNIHLTIPEYDFISVRPKSVDFELYRVLDKGANLTDENKLKKELKLGTFTITGETWDDWTYTVKDLLKYEPRGWYYRYYVREIVPDNSKWNFVPYTVITRDPYFWNGGVGEKKNGSIVTIDGVVHAETVKGDDGTVYTVDDEHPITTGRKNVLKTVSLYANKNIKYASKDEKISTDILKDLYKRGALPKEIVYRVYYQIQDGDSTGWTLLTKDGQNGEAGTPVTMSSKFNENSGAYVKASLDGLLPYAYNETKDNYFEISYRAVEYSAKYIDGDGNEVVIERSPASIEDELSKTKSKNGGIEASTDLGFAGFKSVTAVTPKPTPSAESIRELHPHDFTTTVTNTLDITKLEVTKTWNGEVRDFGSKIKSIEFVLQRRLKTSDGSEAWVNVQKWDNTQKKLVDWTQRIKKTESQTANFDYLPLKDISGNEYEYRAVETKIFIDDGTTDGTAIVVNSADVDSSGKQKGGTDAYIYSSENGTNGGKDNYSQRFKTDFTNTLRLGNLSVTKKWVDFDDEYKLRPQNLKVKLFASKPIKDKDKNLNEITEGQTKKYALESKTLNAPGWRATWSELPICDANGDKITYTLEEYVILNDKEVFVNSYDATSLIKLDGGIKNEGYESKPVELVQDDTVEVEFTNKLATTSYIVEKYWDTDETDPTRAYDDGVKKEVTVALQRYQKKQGSNDEWEWVPVLRNGQAITAVLTYSTDPEKSYRHEWDDLPARDADGYLVRYRAFEQSIKLVSGDKNKTFYVTDKTDAIIDQYFTKQTGIVGGYDYEALESLTQNETGLSVLSNKLKKGNFSITKMWDDDNDRDGIRPDSVTFQLQRKLKSEGKDKWVTLPEAFDRTITNQLEAGDSSWTTETWENLPVENAFGESYSYRVVEKDVDGYVLRLYNKEYSVIERIIKAIEDITAPIRKFIYELITGEKWSESYYDEGIELEFGETKKVTYVNIHDLETVDVEVSKEWIDQKNKYGERPEELAVALYAEYLDPETNATVSEIVKNFELADGQEVELDNPVILNEGNEWKATWSNLPKYKRGFSGKENRKAITYIVKEGTISTEAGSNVATFKESEVKGYTRTKSDTERIETLNSVKYVTELENKVATTSFIVNKYWDEEKDITKANEDYERYVNIALEYSKDEGEHWKPVINHNDDDGNYVASGSEVTAVLEESNDYSYEWNDLPVSGSKGEKLFYRAVEKSIVTVDKKTGKRTEVKLDGNVVGAYNYDFDSKEFNDDHIWIASLSNILKKGEFSVTKVWEDDDDRDGKRPDSITFHLQRKLESDNDGDWSTLSDDFDREITKQTELESGEWSIATWSQLPLKAPNGVSYIYRAVEDEEKAELASRGYKFVAADGVKLEEETLVRSTCSNIHKPGTVDVTVTKKWEDNENKYGDRPEKIKVSLWAYYFDKNNNRVDKPVSQMMIEDDLADNQKFDDVTLTADKNWTVTWKDLPEYKRGEIGKELSYYVVEDDFSDSNETNDNIRIRDGIVVDDNMEYDNKVDGYTHISEDDIVHVTTDASGKKIFVITITNTQETKELVVQKNWENEYAGYGKIVVGAEVVLQRKTENMNDWENVTEAGNDKPTLYVIRKPETSISIKDLPACDAKGIPYLYRAVETRIILSDGSSINTDATKADPTEGHTGSYVYKSNTTETETGFRTDITNRMDTASLKVSKIWDDSNDSKQKRPKTLKITLKTSTVDKNGTTTDIEVPGLKTETVLNAANNWTDDTTWASVPVFTLDGKQIYYTFTEESITDYKASYKSVTYGLEARTGSGETAARVYAVSGQVSEVTFTNSYSGGGNNGGGGGGGGGGNTPGGRDNPSDSTDDGEVLGANREIPEEPEVLGATRRPQTGDNSNMMLYGIGAIISMAVLAAWFYANKKRKKASA